MLDPRFEAALRSGQGVVVIAAGSNSDKAHIERLSTELSKYEISHTVHICSAHKQCNELMELIAAYNEFTEPLVYIGVAGGTDALSGVLSYHAFAPVISCPPDAPNETCLTNPKGSSNATVFHPGNAARFAAQILAQSNPSFRKKLADGITTKNQSLQEANKEWTPRLFD
jgi:phosphoribosylaminoimidazole carboxylase PurE protein